MCLINSTLRRVMDTGKGTVCVTGGNGYMASWLVMRLLQRGYSVRATIRSGQKDISFLTNLSEASQRLQIFNADLDKPQTFDAAIEGCIGVFHVAHPVDLSGREIDEKFNERMINGTLGVLNACQRSKTVKRVVYTSSSATVAWNEEPEDAVLDENAWSDVDFISASKCIGSTYYISKILNEKAALHFADTQKLDLVSVIPPLIAGPFICPTLPASILISLSTFFGIQDGYEFLAKTSLVHIEDVVSAHIHLFEHPNAQGRYICSPHNNITIQWLHQFLSAKYPGMQIPSLNFDNNVKGYKQKCLSSKKLLDSGFKFNYGIDEIFEGAIQCCKDKGFL